MKAINKTNQFVRKKLMALIILSLLVSMFGSQTPVQALGNEYNFTVNSNEWWQDSDPTDGVCQEGNNKNCTFLAAMQEASTKNVDDIVNITLAKGVTYPVYATIAPPVISLATVNIIGNDGIIDVKDYSGSVLTFSGQSKLHLESITIKNGARYPLIINSGAQATLIKCTFHENGDIGSSLNGGAIYNNGELVITGSTFSGNEALHGGAVYNQGKLEIINSTFKSNSANGSGGAIGSTGGDVKISNSTFENNSAKQRGGAIDHTNYQLTISGSTFENNSADNEGGAVAIFLTDSTKPHQISTSTFRTNIAENKGGAIYSRQAILGLSENKFETNTSQEGGAIFLENSWIGVKISKSDFNGNASQSGGGISIKDSKVDISASVFRGNISSGADAFHGGGAVFISNDVSSRQVDFNNTTFSSNQAISHGGGLYVINKGVVNLNNVTITENIANQNQSSTGVGGGLRVENSNGAVVNIQNSIIAQNTSQAPDPAPILYFYHHDWEGTLTSKGYNILGSKGFNSKISGSEIGNFVGSVSQPIDPLLNLLEPFEYFGEILTYAHFPTNDSLAINRGNPTGCKDNNNINLHHDQRDRADWPRIQQGRCDIGAMETTYKPVPALQQLSLSTNSIIGGTHVTGTILLDVSAPQGGTVVNISSNKNFATVPAATVLVPAEQKSVNFLIQTSSVSIGDYAIITAHLNGVTRTANLYVTDSFQVFLPLLVR